MGIYDEINMLICQTCLRASDRAMHSPSACWFAHDG